MQQHNLLWQAFCLQQSTWCQMRKTDASNAKNQDLSHATALMSGVMNVINMDISLWTVLTEYLLQEHQCHTSRHTENHHNTPHQSHCKSSTHHSSSGYCTQDCSRSHSWPTHQSLKYSIHWKGSCSLRSYFNQGNHMFYYRRSKKVQIEEPLSDYYSSDNDSTDSGEESVFKLIEPSPSRDPHEQGGLSLNKCVAI